ncbi:hypothetical protein yfred0001_33760 [Yersinia frederiksenii ATCC 33641]|nr:hypothetical protein yfred0001_33760 [Yersinia frederiksenii ATCC 33641]
MLFNNLKNKKSIYQADETLNCSKKHSSQQFFSYFRMKREQPIANI